MLIRSEFDIQFRLPAPTAIVALLHLHPSVEPLLRSSDQILIESLDEPQHITPHPPDYTKSVVPSRDYLDEFWQPVHPLHCPGRILWLTGTTLIDASPEVDPVYPDAQQSAIDSFPPKVPAVSSAQPLLPGRPVRRHIALIFRVHPQGWQRAVAIRDWVHERLPSTTTQHVPPRPAMDVFTERVGVCRDFQHLAITLTRCHNIPARYVTGYIGDIRQPE